MKTGKLTLGRGRVGEDEVSEYAVGVVSGDPGLKVSHDKVCIGKERKDVVRKGGSVNGDNGIGFPLDV